MNQDLKAALQRAIERITKKHVRRAKKISAQTSIFHQIDEETLQDLHDKLQFFINFFHDRLVQEFFRVRPRSSFKIMLIKLENSERYLLIKKDGVYFVADHYPRLLLLDAKNMLQKIVATQHNDEFSRLCVITLMHSLHLWTEDHVNSLLINQL